MSHLTYKTQYQTEGNYGSTEVHTLYVDHNLSNDYVTFYDENGGIILTVEDTIDNNILDAINRLYKLYSNSEKQELLDGVEYWHKIKN